MKTIWKQLLPAMAAIALTSCDPQTCGAGFIENNTSGNVYLQVDSLQTDTLAAGSTLTIGPMCGLGDGQTPTSMNYYRSVYNDDTLCKKDIRQDSEWITLHPEKYKWEHHFPIKDADF